MINIITRRATLWTDQCLKSDFNKKFPHVSTFHCMWFPLFSCQPRNSSHAITATLKVLIKFYFSVTDDDFSIRDSFLIVMMLNAHKMLWLTPWNEEVDAWLPQLCYKSAWLSCFGGFFFLWSQPVFSLYFSVPVLMEHSSQEFDAAILDHCEKNIKAYFKNKQNISLCNINVSSCHPTFITFMEHMVRVWLLLFLLRVRWEGWYHCHVGTDRKWEEMSDSQAPAPFDVIF